MKLPEKGRPHDALLAEMRALQGGDADWRHGKIFSLIYYAGDDVVELLKDAYATFLYTNGLSPAAFPSIRKFESEVLAMTAGLLGSEEAAGNMTSGGTESILMAIKTARDWARAQRPEISEPEMLLPVTAHPAFEKAANYFDVKPVHFPVDGDYRADADAARDAITENTIVIVGSAPCYPYGTIDPIPALAALAQERGILCHVDACVGAFLLPFVQRLGYEVPQWDFSVPGVTSISADQHKYGYSARGASTVMYRSKELRRYQFFSYADWPGGLYGSPTMAGSRPGGAIAAAWALMRYLGEEGYTRLVGVSMETARELMDGVNAVPGLHVLGKPDASVFSFTSDTVDIFAVGDEMDKRGWHLDRQQMPPKLHMVVTFAHQGIGPQFLADLRESVAGIASDGPAPGGSAAMYGALGTMPDRGSVDRVIRDFLDSSTEPREDPQPAEKP
jgi:glutamate/tyrosine decarboxylase-like PLP-dependent enzyme